MTRRNWEGQGISNVDFIFLKRNYLAPNGAFGVSSTLLGLMREGRGWGDINFAKVDGY